MLLIICIVLFILATRALWLDFKNSLPEPDPEYIRLSDRVLPDLKWNDEKNMEWANLSNPHLLKYWWETVLTENERLHVSGSVKQAIEKRTNPEMLRIYENTREARLFNKGKIMP